MNEGGGMLKRQSHILSVMVAATALVLMFATGVGAQTKPGIPEDPAKDLEKSPDIKGSIVRPRVYFIAPKDGATVKSPFVVKFGVEGMKVHKADEVVPGTGHHHLIVNAGSVTKGEPIPKDEQHLHFGDGATETKLKLRPGDYTLTLQFGDGSHISYGQEMSATIRIKVK
jgi:hypothetical protein